MTDDNNTSGDTPVYPNTFPPAPPYVQPATFPQWIDPNVLERIATALEKIARGMDKHFCGICKKEFSHVEWENRCVNSDEPAHENCCFICNGTDDESETEKCTCGEGEGCCP